MAIYSKHKPDRVKTGLGWPDMDAEGRYLEACFGPLSVVSLYLPSGSSSEERQLIKFSFLDRFMPWLRKLKLKLTATYFHYKSTEYDHAAMEEY